MVPRRPHRFPGCAAIVYGHTHVPQIERVGGVWILNPGSPTARPRPRARANDARADDRATADQFVPGSSRFRELIAARSDSLKRSAPAADDRMVTRHHLLRGDYWRYWWSFAASFEAKATLLLLPVATLALVGAFVLIDGRADAGQRTLGRDSGGGHVDALGAIGGELRTSVLFNLWARSNPGELERYERFEADVLRGTALESPEMVTPFGRALVAALTVAGRVEFDGRKATARLSGV